VVVARTPSRPEVAAGPKQRDLGVQPLHVVGRGVARGVVDDDDRGLLRQLAQPLQRGHQL
jgi:hypothetical protein